MNSAVYSPAAVYYEEADRLEYVRKDVPCVYRRIDSLLTLIFSTKDRDLIGFQIKGFKNFYLRHVRPKCDEDAIEFLPLIRVVEEALSCIGDDVFRAEERARAYQEALNIAEQDQVTLTELPAAA